MYKPTSFMNILFTNKRYFAILFFAILFIDIFVKLNLEAIPFRLISKPLVVISLIIFFVKNNKSMQPKAGYVIAALLSFLIGDILLVFYQFMPAYIIGIILFIVGKLCYTKRFANQHDFSIVSLIPFFILCFVYMVFIMLLVLNNLGSFFIPVLLYLFSCLLLLMFAVLRKGEVNKKSYFIILIGVVIGILCDSITVIQSFHYEDFPFHRILTMLLYGISQYFIITGLIEEKKLEPKKN